MISLAFLPSLFLLKQDSDKLHQQVSLVRLLQQLQDHGVLLLDEYGELWSEFQLLTRNHWDGDKIDDIDLILKTMESRNRVISVESSDSDVNDAICRACRLANAITENWCPDLTIQGTACKCNGMDLCRDDASVATEVSVPKLVSNLNLNRNSYPLHAESWQEELAQFEDEFLSRIFRWSRYLTITDKYVGLTLFKRVERGAHQLVPAGEFEYKRFARHMSVGLAYFVDRFVGMSEFPERITIVTQVPHVSRKELDWSYKALQRLCCELADPDLRDLLLLKPLRPITGIGEARRKVRVDIKIRSVSDASSEGPSNFKNVVGHDRFLETDQERYMLGAGFGLFEIDNRRGEVSGVTHTSLVRHDLDNSQPAGNGKALDEVLSSDKCR